MKCVCNYEGTDFIYVGDVKKRVKHEGTLLEGIETTKLYACPKCGIATVGKKKEKP
jgi:hypothetical protein